MCQFNLKTQSRLTDFRENERNGDDSCFLLGSNMAKANRRDLRFHPTTLRVSESRVSTTMGNCFAKRMHERLNEHNDRYFAKLEQRNSLIQSKKQQSWWKRRNDHPSELLPWEVAPTFAMTVDSPCGGVEETTSLIVTTTTTTTSTTSCFSDNDFHSSSSLTPPPYSIASPQQQQQQQRRRKRRNAADAAVDGGWQVKRKGKALELRLAKHRFLQMAASSSCLSPITLDTAVDSTKPTFNPLLDSSPRRRQKEKWNEDFESSMSKGMVWVEVTRPVLVTATAMSRRAAKGGGEHDHPLLLAIGGEDGIVTVTEIMETAQDSPRRIQSDQTTTSEDDSSEDDASTCRKFGETFEISLRSRIRSLDFSPDGNFLIVGGDGCQAVLLQVILDSSKKRLQDLKLLQEIERVDRVYAVHFSPNSQNLAIGGFDGKVAVVSMSSLLAGERDPVVEISRPGLVFCVDWGPNGFIAIGGSDKNCTIVDGSYNVVHEERRPASIETLKWSNDGVHLAIADREVTILDGRTFAVKCEISNTPSTDDSTRYRITSLTWSPDGAFLAMGGSDGICLVVETKGYALVHEVRRSGSISCLAWGEQKMINGEYRRFLTLSDNSCKVTILKAGAETEGYVSESDDLSSAASSSYFSTGSDWVLREDSFRDIEDSAQDPPPYEIKPQGNITAVAFSKSSKSNMSPYLAYAADDCSLTIMTTRDWKAVFQIEFAKPIRALMFSNSNNNLALGGDEGVLYVLSVPSRSIIFSAPGDSPIYSIGFSKDDERLAIGSSDGVLTLLCPNADWEPIGEIEDVESPILAQDWCSKNLAVGREDGSVTIFDTEKVFSNFLVPTAEFSNSLPVRSVAFGASGRFLAIGGDSGVVSILSAKGGWVLCNQIKMGCSILTTMWSPAGRYLAFAGSNQTCRIMDTITWVEVSEVHGALSSVFASGRGKIACLDWSIDGNWVALGSTGGGIHVLGSSGWQLLAPSLDGLSLNGISAK